MSRYGPPGEPHGPYPAPDEYGPPSDPWGPGTGHGSWGYPTDPHAGRPEPYHQPGYPESPYPDYPDSSYPDSPYPDSPYPRSPYPRSPYQGYGPPPGGYPPPEPYGPPFDEPPRRRNTALYVAVVVLVLLAATGVGYALYLLSGEEPNLAGGETPDPNGTGPGAATPDPSATPRDNVGLSAAMALVGDCLVNDGSAEQTQMRIVRCDDAAAAEAGVVYEVLAVFNERVEGDSEGARHDQAQEVCADTEGYTHHYFEFDETTSFVLCMATQDPPEDQED